MPNALRTWSLPLVLCLALAGCGGSPAAPSTLEPPPTGAAPAPAAPTPAPTPDAPGGFSQDPASELTTPDGKPADAVAVDPATGDPTGVPAAEVVGKGTIAERAFIDGLAAELKTGLAMLADASANAQHPELKAYAARAQKDYLDQLNQLTTWRQSWFGSAAVPEGDKDVTAMFAHGAEYDWMWADEMTRRLGNVLELASSAGTARVRPEVRAMAAAIVKDWPKDRDQLNAWVDVWLNETPSQENPYEGVEL